MVDKRSPRDKSETADRLFRLGSVVLETATTAATLPAGAVSRDRGHIFDAADLKESEWRQGARKVVGGQGGRLV